MLQDMALRVVRFLSANPAEVVEITYSQARHIYHAKAHAQAKKLIRLALNPIPCLDARSSFECNLP